MPNIKHIVSLPYVESFRSKSVIGSFDLNIEKKLVKSWDINIPIEEKPWGIGLIIGASGSGKSTIAEKLFPGKVHKNFNWRSPCFLDDFSEDLKIKDIIKLLTKVGFSSPPQWLLPYSSLSTGQKFRADLARCLLEDEHIIVYDEFTSVVDRQVAMATSHALSKLISKLNKKFVAVTCHSDVEQWLQPDWVVNISENSFKWGSLRRKNIEIKIKQVHHSIWNLFKQYHYLDSNINKSSICFSAFIDDTPVAFSAWIHHFGKTKGKIKRAHRTVVMPDYQGLGIGGKLTDAIAQYWIENGFRACTRLSHPSLINARINSPLWKLKSKGMQSTRNISKKRGEIKSSIGRNTYTFEYVGRSCIKP